MQSNDWKIGAWSARRYNEANGVRYRVGKNCYVGRAIESEMTWENTGIGTWWWIWYRGEECPVKDKDTVYVEDEAHHVLGLYFWKRYKRGYIKLKIQPNHLEP